MVVASGRKRRLVAALLATTRSFGFFTPTQALVIRSRITTTREPSASRGRRRRAANEDEEEAREWWDVLSFFRGEVEKKSQKRAWDGVFEEQRTREAQRRALGKSLVEQSVSQLVATERSFAERQWSLERAARFATLRFVNDEWEREQAAREAARAFLVDETERLQLYDAQLAAQLGGAPELQVCTAKVSCARYHADLLVEDLTAMVKDEKTTVRCTTSCMGHCRQGRVVIAGLPRGAVAHVQTARKLYDEDRSQALAREDTKMRARQKREEPNLDPALVQPQLAKLVDRCRPYVPPDAEDHLPKSFFEGPKIKQLAKYREQLLRNNPAINKKQQEEEKRKS